MIPFSMLEILIAHHTLLMPHPSEMKHIAKGIRRVFRMMLTIAGGMVLPVP